MPSQAAQARHDAACRESASTYVDPDTGYQVFTRVGLLARGQCCGAGCRHCPYHHESVSLEQRPRRIQQPAWLSGAMPQAETQCALFWSGGKDSFLAYQALRRSGHAEIVLITTFDRASGVIAHQDLSIETIVEQAKHLGAPLLGVPLFSDSDYVSHIAEGLALVPQATSLAFGDLHLAHIREWREEAFRTDARTAHLELLFPIWHRPYDSLLQELMAADVSCTLSAVIALDQGIQVGDVFDREFVNSLPSGMDAFGENGEFHTVIAF